MADKQNYLTYTDNTSDSNDKTMENLHKQIIVDNVDVSGCEHYTGNIGYLTDKNWTCRAKIQGTKCEDCPNCYYKNWQRKEQECEELKKRVKGEIHLGNRYKEDFVEQFNEAEKLKAELEQEKALKETYLACYKAKHEDIKGELFKLRQYKKSKQASYEEMQKRWQEAEKHSRKLENELSEAKKMLEFYQGCFAGKGGK